MSRLHKGISTRVIELWRQTRCSRMTCIFTYLRLYLILVGLAALNMFTLTVAYNHRLFISCRLNVVFENKIFTPDNVCVSIRITLSCLKNIIAAGPGSRRCYYNPTTETTWHIHALRFGSVMHAHYWINGSVMWFRVHAETSWWSESYYSSPARKSHRPRWVQCYKIVQCNM